MSAPIKVVRDFAYFNDDDIRKRWGAPLIDFPAMSSKGCAYGYLISSNLTDAEACAKLKLIRRAQRQADAARRGPR